MMTDKIERRSGFTYITALPKEAGFPMSMDYDEEQNRLTVVCKNGEYQIDLKPGSRVYRIAVLSGEDPGDQAENESDS